MNDLRPDFIVIGAMKSATTTLHEQLARQPGLFMSRPKEPNFFSDDAIYARGLPWYLSLFQAAAGAALRGESSTHYFEAADLPPDSRTAGAGPARGKDRLCDALPIDRLVSHYVHERSLESVPEGIDRAIDLAPGLADYGLYSMHCGRTSTRTGPRMCCRFSSDGWCSSPRRSWSGSASSLATWAGSTGTPRCGPRTSAASGSARAALREMLVQAPPLTAIRRRLAPRLLTEHVKLHWRIKGERIDLCSDIRNRLFDCFDPDLEQLGSWLGVGLNCANFADTTEARPYNWC